MVKRDVGTWDYDGLNASDPSKIIWSGNPDNIQREVEIRDFACKQLDINITDTTEDNDYFFVAIGLSSFHAKAHVDAGTIRMTIHATLHNAFTETALKALEDGKWSQVVAPVAVTNATGLGVNESRALYDVGKQPVVGIRLRIEGTVNPTQGQVFVVLQGFSGRAAT